MLMLLLGPIQMRGFLEFFQFHTDEEVVEEAASGPPFVVEDEPFIEELFVAGTCSDDVVLSDGDVFPLV